jgi:integrase
MSVLLRNGKWYIDYYADGLRIRECVGKSKTEAINALAVRKAEIVQGRYNFESKKRSPLFEEFADEYLKYSEANKKSFKRDISSLGNIKPCFKGKRLSDICALDVERYKSNRKNQVKPGTVNRELSCLKHLYTKAIEWGKAENNPCKGVKMFREDNKKERILSDVEAEKIIAASTENLKAIIITALKTGMRLGEILNLQWKDVELDKGVITVEKSKNGKVRKIPINKLLTNILSNIKTKGKIFVFGNGVKPLVNVRDTFLRAVKAAGVDHVRFHDLRHTFATNLVMNGFDIVTVKELLGHSSIEMTMRYSHPTPENKKRAVESLDNNNLVKYGHNMDTGAFQQKAKGDLSGCFSLSAPVAQLDRVADSED